MIMKSSLRRHGLLILIIILFPHHPLRAIFPATNNVKVDYSIIHVSREIEASRRRVKLPRGGALMGKKEKCWWTISPRERVGIKQGRERGLRRWIARSWWDSQIHRQWTFKKKFRLWGLLFLIGQLGAFYLMTRTQPYPAYTDDCIHNATSQTTSPTKKRTSTKS